MKSRLYRLLVAVLLLTAFACDSNKTVAPKDPGTPDPSVKKGTPPAPPKPDPPPPLPK